jgi:hypothetical protein
LPVRPGRQGCSPRWALGSPDLTNPDTEPIGPAGKWRFE